MNISKLKLTAEYNGKKYALNWVEEWRDGVLLVGATVLSLNVLGTPGDILFAKKENNKLYILGKWGTGPLYKTYIYESTIRKLGNGRQDMSRQRLESDETVLPRL